MKQIVTGIMVMIHNDFKQHQQNAIHSEKNKTPLLLLTTPLILITLRQKLTFYIKFELYHQNT